MRFELTHAQICDPDGVVREYEIIKDRSMFRTEQSCFGAVTSGGGFIRCHGKRYVGSFGRSPVFAGGPDDVYYAPVSFFDGSWAHSGRNSRGNYDAVTPSSGKLFAALEEFSAANSVAANY